MSPNHEIADGEVSSNSDITIDKLKDLWKKSSNGIIIGYLNIKSIRNKFAFLPAIYKYVHIFTIAESKLYDSFKTSQFLIEGFSKPFRYDRNRCAGGLMIYAREGVPIRQHNANKLPKDIEIRVFDLSSKKHKYLLLSAYRPPSQYGKYFFNEIEKCLDFYCTQYEKFILIGDLNFEPTELVISDLMENYSFANLVKNPTCCKSDNPSRIALMKKNSKSNLEKPNTIETGLSDFNAMILTKLKCGFSKQGSRYITYRDYKQLQTGTFQLDLLKYISPYVNFCGDYNSFDSLITNF